MTTAAPTHAKQSEYAGPTGHLAPGPAADADPSETKIQSHTGWLFDLYARGADMVLWFITDDGRRLRVLDAFAPVFYADGFADTERRPPHEVFREPHTTRRTFFKTLGSMRGLEAIGPSEQLDFWTGRPREVEAIRITDLGLYNQNLRQLARRHPDLVYFNADIAPEIHYGYGHEAFPTARCAFEVRGDRLVACRALDAPTDTEYAPLPLVEAELKAEGVLTGRRPRLRSLTFCAGGQSITWDEGRTEDLLASFRDCLRDADPDLIWTDGGDSTLFPALLELAARHKIDLGFDREPGGVERALVHEGRSYISYGRVLYQAPDYPLFGRWHIDRRNSFWTDETGLHGLLEVARMSKIPVQRAARRSIGTGISSIQLDYAYRQGYLIPWKKSQAEAWKTASTLLKSDRGGLVYQPLVGVYEDILELDFASMYPMIMVRCNVSPETIDCTCCGPGATAQPPSTIEHAPEKPDGEAEFFARLPDRVPEIDYTICRRRRGLISHALEPIINKRTEYKRLRKIEREARESKDPTLDENEIAEHAELYRQFDGRQSALKWLLVCCFGYLGYRNARFGRIEAHESTCAFSRDKLLQTREICEARGFEMLHAIVDCVWLRKPGMTQAEIDLLCQEINTATNLEIAIEGRYRWIAFLPSRQNPDMPVPNRYFGCFENGDLKFRGIELRRSDQAPYVKTLQQTLLDRLRETRNLAEARSLSEELAEIVRDMEAKIRNREVPIEALLLRRKTSKEADEYKNNSMTAVAARQAARAGLPLHAGEAIYFLVLNAKDRDPDSRLRLVTFLRPEDTYDVEFYAEQLRRAAATLLEPIMRKPLSTILGEPAPPNEQSAEPEPGPVQLDLFAPA